MYVGFSATISGALRAKGGTPCSHPPQPIKTPKQLLPMVWGQKTCLKCGINGENNQKRGGGPPVGYSTRPQVPDVRDMCL